MLLIKEIYVKYGEVEALRGVTIKIEKGEIVAIIGSNGAGKSTTLKAISGIVSPYKGSIEFLGKVISGLPPHKIVSMGIAHIPEGRLIFSDQNVKDNLVLGAFSRYFKTKKNDLEKDINREFKRFPILNERKNQIAGTLSGGEQQMLAIARGLMSNPKLLILDEPSLGLAPFLVKEISNTIKLLREQGTTILLVEQLASVALKIADRAYVMENGKIIMEGLGKELLNNDKVIKAYLGT